jgi:DNA topoisomerase-2
VLLSRPYDPDVCVDYSSERVTFPTYFDREYIHFPHYAIYRTIPNVMDGLKPSQRKVLYTAFRRNLREPVKVVQFAGAVLETASYHHGETSLQGAIISMARRYCGSNNINLLNPDGPAHFRAPAHGRCPSHRCV